MSKGAIMKEDKPLIPILLDPNAETTNDTSFKWSQRSLKAMEGIHPDLRKVCDRALQLTTQDFVITEGKRTIERERQLVAEGKSKTMKSRHIGGFAVDYVDYPGFTYDEGKCKIIADAFKKAAHELNIPISWGGDWEHFKDGDHIELSSTKYPD
jgi:peptidoglycan L-alanyl-D-glutamate endopeptidase CwlK